MSTSVRRALRRLWDGACDAGRWAGDAVLDAVDGVRERVGDAVAGTRHVLRDGWDALLDRIADLGRVAAVAWVVAAIGIGAILFRFAVSSGEEGAPPAQPAPVLRSPVSLMPPTPHPAPSLALDQ